MNENVKAESELSDNDFQICHCYVIKSATMSMTYVTLQGQQKLSYVLFGLRLLAFKIKPKQFLEQLENIKMCHFSTYNLLDKKVFTLQVSMLKK
jgi:hypothetical protein